MGMFNNLLQLLRKNKEKMTVLVIGLNYSGKSSIIYQLKRCNKYSKNKIINMPTIGYNIEEFYNQGILFTMIDMSGAWKYRNLWQHQFKHCQGIIYVIDSSDKMRLVVAKEELTLLLRHPEFQERIIPILFYNNKIDCMNSLSCVNIAVDLYSINNKPWHVISSNALTGNGIEEGIQWLIQQIRLTSNDCFKEKK